MRTSTRHSDDADVIRARLRLLLDEAGRSGGWVPRDDRDDVPSPVGHPSDRGADPRAESAPAPGEEGVPGGFGRHRAPGTAVRVAPGRRGVWSLWLTGVLAAGLVAVGTWSHRPQVDPAPPPTVTAPPSDPVGAGDPAEPPPARPSVGTAAGASATVVVSVVGLVARPGVVTLPEGARVADAIGAAGGLLPEADPASVNLAARVSDGEQVAVGVPGAAPGGGAGPPGASPGGGPLDLNAAGVAELDALPGIGPVLAQRIVDHREQVGRFTTVEQLDDVPGIGPAIYAELVDLVAV